MKTTLIILTITFGLLIPCNGQTSADQSSTIPVWTEADRKYLLDNLVRSKQEIIEETKNLTKEQWAFKESPDRWNINQIVEHIAICEIELLHEISAALGRAPNPDNSIYSPDSLYVDKYPNESKKQDALNYTKPFSFAIPLGNNEGRNNVIWLTTLRNESIEGCEAHSCENVRLEIFFNI